MATINGTNGNDNLRGTLARDVINGFAGNDILLGLEGPDVLLGGFGDNILDGGLESATDISNFISDTASYEGSVNNVIASLETGKATFFGGSDTFRSIENLIGSENDDVLTGNSVNNRLEGRGGSDRIFGGLGNDILQGGDGADVLEGGDGVDNLSGDKGNDTMIGGNGDDSFNWDDGDGSDVIRGDSGQDTLSFKGSATQGDVITLNPVGTELSLQRTNLTPINLQMQSVEKFNINGLNGDDVLVVKDLRLFTGITKIEFNGGSGNDRMQITSTSANIEASGGLGNDSLVGADFSDKLFGQEGNDILMGGSGNDVLTGADAASLTPGRGEIDTLIGGAGRDKFVLNNFYNDGDGLADGDASNLFDNLSASFDGTGDFARIVDFRAGEDQIQLQGPRNGYELRAITNSLRGGSSATDVGIFKKGAFLQPAELIAIVQDAPNALNLANTVQFTFI